MNKFLRIMAMLVITSGVMSAKQKLMGYCEAGNNPVITNTIVSTTVVQKSFPSCTVTVYITGTLTLASIFADNLGTTLSNPFTANNDGSWGFYASNGIYDVNFSNGGIPTPFTLGGNLINDPSVFYNDVTLFGAFCDGMTDDAPAINAALANGGTVLLPQKQTCRLASTITIPAAYTELQCNGSTLLYTGTGDLLDVSAFGNTPPYVTGKVEKCLFDATGNANGNLIGVHQFSRLGFVYEDVRFSNFSTTNSVGMEWENIAPSGTSPGFTEQSAIRKADFFNCNKGLKYINTAGFNSFFYNYITDVHFTLLDGQIGLSIEGNGTSNNLLVFGGTYDLRVNISANVSARGVSVTGGAVVERQNYFGVGGEKTSGSATDYSLYVDAASSVYTTGHVSIDNTGVFYGGAESSLVVLPPVNPTTGSVHFENGGGISPPRHCKYDLGYPSITPNAASDAKFWLANFGGTENDCNFQILKRATDNTNPDVDIQGTGPAPVNIFFTDALSGNIGIGPGWSVASAPVYNLDLGKVGTTFRTPNTFMSGTSKGFHQQYVSPNPDESFSVLIGAGASTATFNFTTAWNSLPMCIATPNTTLVSYGANPIIAGWAIAPSVSSVTLNQWAMNLTPGGSYGTSTTLTFPVTYFIHCKGNPN
jgi:hypothetical protein